MRFYIFIIVIVFSNTICFGEAVKLIDYRFDTGRGTTIKDYSDFQNDATVIGPEWAEVIHWQKDNGAKISGYGAFIPGNDILTPQKFDLKLSIKPIRSSSFSSPLFCLYVSPYYLKDRTKTWKQGYKTYYPLYYIFKVELIGGNRIAILLSLKDDSGKLVRKTFRCSKKLSKSKFSDIIISFDCKQLKVSIDGTSQDFPAAGKLYYDLPQLFSGHVNGGLSGLNNCVYRKVEFYDLAPSPQYGLKVRTPYYLNFFAEDEEKQIDVIVDNLHKSARHGKLYFNVSDYKGKQVYRGYQDVTLKPRQANSFKFSVPGKQRGCFWIKCAFCDDDGDVVQRDSQFSVGANRNTKELPATSPFGRCDTATSGYTRTKMVEGFGEKWVRVLCDWRTIERRKGEFNFTVFDYTVKHHLSQGREIYIIFAALAPSWLKPQKYNFISPNEQNFKLYERYIEQIIKRYPGKIKGYDISGEADARVCFRNASPDFYIKIAEITKKVRDKYDPGAFLAGPSACRGGLDSQTDLMLKNGAGKYWERLDTHYIGGAGASFYLPEDAVVQTIQGSRALLKKHGLDLPIMDSETGYVVCSRRAIDSRPMTKAQLKAANERKETFTTNFGWRNKPHLYAKHSRDELTCAQHTVRRMILCLSENVAPSIRHGVGTMTYNSEINPVLERNLDTGVLLPGIAWATMIKELSWAKFIRRVDLGNDDLQGYLFYDQKRKQNLAVLWSKRGAQNVLINPDSSKVEKYNIWGNPESLTRVGDKLLLTLEESPIYLRKAGQKVAIWGVPLEVSATPNITVGHSGFLKIKINNFFSKKLSGTIEITAPQGLKIIQNKFDVNILSGKSQSFNTKIIPDAKLAGFTDIQVVFNSVVSGKLSRLCRIKVEKAPAAVQQISQNIKIDGNGSEWPQNIPWFQIKNNEQVKIGFPKTFDVGHKNPYKEWQGPSDLSAKFKLGWNKDNLYLFIDVVDPERKILTHPGGGIRAVDGIELYLDGRNPDRCGRNPYDIPNGVRHIFVSPAANRKSGKMLRVKGTEGEKLADMIQVASKEKSNGYTIEMKIPITKTFFPQLQMIPGRVIGFNLQLNDADRLDNLKTMMMWNGKDKCNIEPANFGKIILK